MMGQMPGSDEIRRLVREALRSAAPDEPVVSRAGQVGRDEGQGMDVATRIRAELSSKGEACVPVQLAGDFDLNLFVGRILSLADASDIRSAMAQGKVRFVMGGGGVRRAGEEKNQRKATTTGGGTCVIEKGVLNERKIAEIAKSHVRVELGPAVVLTPLAKDRARELKIELIRRRP